MRRSGASGPAALRCHTSSFAYTGVMNGSLAQEVCSPEILKLAKELRALGHVTLAKQLVGGELLLSHGPLRNARGREQEDRELFEANKAEAIRLIETRQAGSEVDTNGMRAARLALRKKRK